MDQLKRMMEKKKSASKMHPLEKKAKMEVVEHLQKMAQDAMGGKLKGMHKVTVASDSPEGLQTGLHKAEDMTGDEDMYAEGGMTESHPMSALSAKGQKDPMKSMADAEDDSHEDHENFIHSENEEDGEDGMEAYGDADADHLLEVDQEAQHKHDEHAEGDEDAYAMGGEIGSMYDHMDESMINEHLKHLLKRQKGLAK